MKINLTTKWYMKKPGSVLANEWYKILWDFKIQIDYQIQARKPDLESINIKKRELVIKRILLADNRIRIKGIKG